MKRQLYMLYVGGEFFGLFADYQSAHARGRGFLRDTYKVEPVKLNQYDAESVVDGDLSYCWDQQQGMMVGA